MISVILPIYNVAEYLDECLRSVLEQSYSDIEVICVNDCTPDNSMEIVQAWAERDARVRVVENAINRGLGGARNAGLEVAQGDYIAFVDTDDRIQRNMLADMLELMQRNKSDLVFCDLWLLNADGSVVACKPLHDVQLAKCSSWKVADGLQPFTNMWPSAWNKLYRREVITSHRLRFLENIQYEDHLFYYQYLTVSGGAVSYLPKPLYFYRHQRSDSITGRISPRICEIFTVLDLLGDFFGNYFGRQNEQYQQIYCKLSVRLLWERTRSFTATDHWTGDYVELTENYISRARLYLSRFSRSQIGRYRDRTIPMRTRILLGPLRYWISCFCRVDKDRKYKYLNLMGVRIIVKKYCH